MRKTFIEPDIQRLKFNLNENIASSSSCAFPSFIYRGFDGRVLQDGDYVDFIQQYTPILINNDVAGAVDLLRSNQWAPCISIIELFHES